MMKARLKKTWIMIKMYTFYIKYDKLSCDRLEILTFFIITSH